MAGRLRDQERAHGFGEIFVPLRPCRLGAMAQGERPCRIGLIPIPFTYQLLNCLLTMISDRPRLRIRGPDRWRAPRRCFLRGGGLRISLAWAWSPRLFRSPKFAKYWPKPANRAFANVTFPLMSWCTTSSRWLSL